ISGTWYQIAKMDETLEGSAEPENPPTLQQCNSSIKCWLVGGFSPWESESMAAIVINIAIISK
ncbi:hypothetical protein, partial [Staphylococcus pseudintermedius]|uniref:hypothetical protein n=1 Tax=Staphylococcus pseudintermedius TaxID=283734 RepID=UPI0036F3E5F7